MSDIGAMYRALRSMQREERARLGVPCLECQRLRPKATPTVLLPQQRCRIHDYRDPRQPSSFTPTTRSTR